MALSSQTPYLNEFSLADTTAGVVRKNETSKTAISGSVRENETSKTAIFGDVYHFDPSKAAILSDTHQQQNTTAVATKA